MAPEDRPTKNLKPAPAAAEIEIPRPQKFYVRDQGEVIPGHLAEKTVPEDSSPVNNAVDFAIAAGHLAQDRPDRLGVGDIAGMVRGLDPGGLQIRQGLSHLHGPVISSERLSRCRPGARLAGIHARIKRGPAQKDQAGPEGRQAAGQVGGDARGAPGHDDHVSRAQVQTCRAVEDRRGDAPLRSEDPAIPMNHLHRGVASVQSPGRRRRAGRYPGRLPRCETGPMGIPGRRCRNSPSIPSAGSPSRVSAFSLGMDQHDEFFSR